jgi:transmembrane sensor
MPRRLPVPPADALSAIEETAADWLVRRNEGLSPEAESQFQAWLAADPRHAEAFSTQESAWATLAFPAESGQAGVALQKLVEREATRARARRRKLGVILFAGGMAAAAALVFVLRPAASPLTPAAPTTMVARPNLHTLPDGSTVELNAEGAFESEFTATQRGIRLTRGEALFAVTKDPSRPFVVTAGGVTVRAVGTAFTVRFDPARVDVLVTEGRVAVQSPAGRPEGDEAILVAAGHRVEVPAAPGGVLPAVLTVSPAQIAAKLAWREHRTEFTRTPLAEAVALFNRNNHVQLKLADAKTGELRLSGIFWADDPEGFVRLLEGLNVSAVRAGDTIHLRAF